MGINEWGTAAQGLNAPKLGDPGGWADSVAAVLNRSDVTVDARIDSEVGTVTATIGNLLTANQASGTDALGTTAGFIPQNGTTTLSSSTTYFSQGGRSLKAACAGSAQYEGPRITGLSVVAGNVYTFTVRVRVSVTAEVRVGVYSSAAGWSGDYTQTAVAAGSFVTLTYTTVATGDASDVQIFCDTGTVATAVDIYTDQWGFWAGAGGEWAMPGTPITNLGTRITRPNTDDRLVEVWNGTGWSVVDYDSGWRDVSGLLRSPWTGTVWVRRDGYSCSAIIGDVKGAAAAAYLLDLPTGFRTAVGVGVAPFSARFRENVMTGAWYDFAAYGAELGFSSPPGWNDANAVIGVAITWTTKDAIPTSLPGTLVSPAPQ